MKLLNPTAILARLRSNSKRLQKLIQNGKFNQLTHKKRSQWQLRIQRLQHQLSNFGQFKQVRKVVAGAGIVLGLALGNTANAQNFALRQTNPFGLAGGNMVSLPTTGDIDNDGDLDMVIGGTALTFYENIGDSTTPNFNLVTNNSPFANVAGYAFSMPTLVDIDDDGDLDIFVTEYYSNTLFFENVGTPTVPNFNPAQQMPFGLNTADTANAFIRHTFVDIDNDMDLDIISGDYYGGVSYFENTGTAQNAAFTAPVTTPFGMVLPQNSYYALPALTDIDSDGDLDMFIGIYYGDILYYENTGTASVPVFGTSTVNPFNITMNASNSDFIAPIFADIDNDGDDDLFAGSYGANAEIFFQDNLSISVPNNLPTSADTALTMNQDEMLAFDASNFSFADVDSTHFLYKIKVITPTTNGTFELFGLPIVANTEILATSMDNLLYTPQAGQYGANFDSFTFEVSDGYDYNGTPYTFTINVNALPSTIQTTVSTIQNTDYVFDVNDFTFNDPDNGTFQEIQILTLPNKGDVKLNGTAVISGQVISTSDFANLVFTPDPNETGFPYTDFQFAVSDGMAFSQPSTLFVEVDFPISTQPIEDFATVTLTPNPVTETANLHIETAVSASATLSVQNIAGQVVLNQNIELNGNFNASIDVSNWARGIYIVRLQTIDGNVWTEKLVVQ